jgi:hypothetical protein
MDSKPDERTTTRWGKAHGWWLLHPMMDADRFCILAALSTYADDQGTCHPSQATLARHLKRSRPWVNRVIAELTEFGLIEKRARTRSGNAGTTSCEYRLVAQSGMNIQDEAPATQMTASRQDGDAPCQDGDTTQSKTKQNQYTRPGTRDPNSQSIQPEAKKRPRTEPVPQAWRPSAEVVAVAKTLCPAVDLDAHAVMFAAKSRSKGYHYLTNAIDDAWLAWLLEDGMRNDVGKNPQRKNVGPGAPFTTVRLSPYEIAEQRFAAWAASAASPPLPTAHRWR